MAAVGRTLAENGAVRLLPAYSLVFILAVLLAGTTTAGTGSGVHQLALVHPLFSHVHLVNGRILTHEQMQQDGPATPAVEPRPTRGPALGAGAGPGAADGGLASGLVLPVQGIAAVSGSTMEWLRTRLASPPGHREPPPDPPPPA